MKVFLANNINSFFKNNLFLITQANAKVIPMHENDKGCVMLPIGWEITMSKKYDLKVLVTDI